MTEYVNMWKNYINFSDRTTPRGYWMAFLFNLLAGFVLGLVAGLLKLGFLPWLYSVAIFIPTIAMAVRRLRDAGKHWAWLLLNLTGIGSIVVLILLCLPSVPDNGIPRV